MDILIKGIDLPRGNNVLVVDSAGTITKVNRWTGKVEATDPFSVKAIEAGNTRPDPWHTGVPTEDGYYLCHFQFYSEDYESDEEGYDIPYWFKNGSWEGNDENVRIIAWQKIEPFEASEERE